MIEGQLGGKIAYQELRAEDFPFTLTFWDEATGETLWEYTVFEPGAITIPGYAPRKVGTTVTFARHGLKVVTTSDGTSRTESC